MSTRSLLTCISLFAFLFGLIAVDAGARGWRCKKRMRSCSSSSRSASWGGSYGSVGSCGTPVRVSCAPTCSVQPSCGSSFGSMGGSGGSYVSTGSSGGMIISSAPVYSQPVHSAPVYSEPINNEPSVLTQPDEQPQIIYEDQTEVIDEGTSTEHRHIHHSTSETSNPTQPAGDGKLTSKSNAPQDMHAYLVLWNVPSGAEIRLLGMKMTARGSLRRYRIPVLAAHQDYDYHIELKMPGKEQTAEAKTIVRAGESTELWVSEKADELVFVDDRAQMTEPSPLALR